MQQALREIAGPAAKIQIAVETAARRVGLTYWRTFDLWYGKARRIEDSEHAAITAALQRKRKEATRNELHDLRLRLARLEARLAASDEDFSRETVARPQPAFG